VRALDDEIRALEAEQTARMSEVRIIRPRYASIVVTTVLGLL
jgi:hypothetical protein